MLHCFQWWRVIAVKTLVSLPKSDPRQWQTKAHSHVWTTKILQLFVVVGSTVARYMRRTDNLGSSEFDLRSFLHNISISVTLQFKLKGFFFTLICWKTCAVYQHLLTNNQMEFKTYWEQISSLFLLKRKYHYYAVKAVLIEEPSGRLFT